MCRLFVLSSCGFTICFLGIEWPGRHLFVLSRILACSHQFCTEHGELGGGRKGKGLGPIHLLTIPDAGQLLLRTRTIHHGKQGRETPLQLSKEVR